MTNRFGAKLTVAPRGMSAAQAAALRQAALVLLPA